MDRGVWQAIVHGVTKSQTGTERLSTHLFLRGKLGLYSDNDTVGKRLTQPLQVLMHYDLSGLIYVK